MSMKDLFMQNKALEDIRQRLQAALQDSDQEKVSKAFSDMFQYYAEVNRQDYEDLKQERDVQVLASRGVRQLTAKEKTYYQKLGEAMKSADPARRFPTWMLSCRRRSLILCSRTWRRTILSSGKSAS